MTRAQDVVGYARAVKVFTPPDYPRWRRPPVVGDRVRTFRGRGIKCPTCGERAIRLIVPWDARAGEWQHARCNRCAAS